jgi:glycogen operon protein
MAVFLNGQAITEPGLRGEQIVDDSFLLLLNAGGDGVRMRLPGEPFGQQWHPVLDTARRQRAGSSVGRPLAAGASRLITAHSVVLLRRG